MPPTDMQHEPALPSSGRRRRNTGLAPMRGLKGFQKDGPMADTPLLLQPRTNRGSAAAVGRRGATVMGKTSSSRGSSPCSGVARLSTIYDDDGASEAVDPTAAEAAGEASSPSKAPAKPTVRSLKHRRSRAARMAFIERAIQEKRQDEVTGTSRDIVDPDERAHAFECYARYFPPKGPSPFDEVLLRKALADFGHAPKNRIELHWVRSIFAQHRGGGFVDFNEFCVMVQESRGFLRAAMYEGMLQAWKYVDLDDRGALSKPQLWCLLERLGLATRSGPAADRKSLKELFAKVEWDRTMRVSVDEAEHLVVRVREMRESETREEERALQAIHDLPDGQLSGRPGDLAALNAAFEAEDVGSSGVLGVDEVRGILSEFGVLRAGVPRGDLAKILRDVVLQTLIAEGKGQEELEIVPASFYRHVGFAEFVAVVERFRRDAREQRSEQVSTLFDLYDHGRTGGLDTDEFVHFLVDLDILPRSVEQQKGLRSLLEEVDADQSGTLSLDEVELAVQQASEKMLRVQREQESKQAKLLSFDVGKVRGIRDAFEQFDADSSGSLGVEEFTEAVAMLGIQVAETALARLFDQVDIDRSGFVDFSEFMILVKCVQDALPLKDVRCLLHAMPEVPVESDRAESRAPSACSDSSLDRASPRAAGSTPKKRPVTLQSLHTESEKVASRSKTMRGQAFGALISGDYDVRAARTAP
uniref:EF-hand domain-containing protein n=1 Tax=Zooxanthella nutricula TaxID=1333877 RepID=A0A7S2LEG0_9DINO